MVLALFVMGVEGWRGFSDGNNFILLLKYKMSFNLRSVLQIFFGEFWGGNVATITFGDIIKDCR